MINQKLLSTTIFLFLMLFAFRALGETIKLSSMVVGECELTLEAEEKWKTLRLRAHHPEGKRCNITKENMKSILNEAFSKNDAPLHMMEYKSLFFGRIINYPWLSQYLSVNANRDENWSVQKENPKEGNINNFVKSILSRDEILQFVRDSFIKINHDVVGVSVEKVLVGNYKEIPQYQGKIIEGKIPFDALLWFTLEKKEK